MIAEQLHNLLSDGATAKAGAQLAKVIIAAEPLNAELLASVAALLADTIIDPPKRKRGGQRVVQSVDEKVNNHAAISEYARLVNARNILDGKALTYPGYADLMTRDEAKAQLKRWGIPQNYKQGFKNRAREYVCKEYGIKNDKMIKLVREYCQ